MNTKEKAFFDISKDKNLSIKPALHNTYYVKNNKMYVTDTYCAVRKSTEQEDGIYLYIPSHHILHT